MSNKLYSDLGIEFSEDVNPAGVKIMLWGNTATRKTEFVVRNFPHVLVIDVEGNTDAIVNHSAIPKFLRVKTKDVRQVLKAIDAAASGTLKFPDGSPVETVSIDSWSVLWSVQSDVASVFAEKRAANNRRSVDEANITMTDWSKSKRPMKRILNAINGSRIKYLFFIARAKDEYESAGGADAKKTGKMVPEVMKGTEYDMNLALQFDNSSGKWSFTTTKVQGPHLGELFPLEKKQFDFPFEKFFGLYEGIDTSKSSKTKSEDDIASEIVDENNKAETQHTQANLIQYAKSKGVSASDLGAILKANGITGFEAAKWDDMIAAVDNAQA